MNRSKKLLVLFLLVACVSCQNSGNANQEALKTKNITCPEGVNSEYSSWDLEGGQLVCKLKHGPFVAAEGGLVVLEGEYSMGKPSGTWIWFDKAGRVEKTVEY